MLPKGKRRQSVREEYRAARTASMALAARERTQHEAAEQAAAAAASDASYAELKAAKAAKAGRGGGVQVFGPESADDVFDDSAGFDSAGFDTAEEAGYDTAEWADEVPVPRADRNVVITSGATGSKVAAETEDAPRYANPYADLDKRVAAANAAEISVLHDDDFDVAEGNDAVRSFTVEAAGSGLRLDAFLTRALPDVSRARVQQLIEKGSVQVNAKPAKASLKLRGGERVSIAGGTGPEPLHAEPEDLPIDVVYEDADLLVINKAAGMQVHPGAGDAEHKRGTLVNAVLGYLLRQGQQRANVEQDSGKGGGAGPLSLLGGGLRPGVVHRLDKDTSGLMIVAKTDAAHRELSRMFADREVGKQYIALVHGELRGAGADSKGSADEGTVRLAIGRDPQRRIRMSTRVEDGKAAVSHWRVRERLRSAYGPFTLLDVRIETGRTHQIRVHLAALGHRVVGDTLYGAPERIAPVDVQPGTPVHTTRKRKPRQSVPGADTSLALGRNFLHAAQLRFAHPRTGEAMEFTAELPPELQQFLTTLEQAPA